DAYLYIIGDGDVYNKLKKLASNFGVRNKVSFVPRIPFEDMMQYTFNADIGLSLDKDTNQNYAISLTNKLFEYIHAELPIIITPLNEIKTVVETLDICDFLVNHNPLNIASQINSLLNDKEKRDLYSENCRKVKHILCWEEEQKKIIELLSSI
ncbi:MAG: glycosyltransferase, partial [Bacteroidales bacterium]